MYACVCVYLRIYIYMRTTNHYPHSSLDMVTSSHTEWQSDKRHGQGVFTSTKAEINFKYEGRWEVSMNALLFILSTKKASFYYVYASTHSQSIDDRFLPLPDFLAAFILSFFLVLIYIYNEISVQQSGNRHGDGVLSFPGEQKFTGKFENGRPLPGELCGCWPLPIRALYIPLYSGKFSLSPIVQPLILPLVVPARRSFHMAGWRFCSFCA